MNRKVIVVVVCMAAFGIGLMGFAIAQQYGQDYERAPAVMERLGVFPEEMEAIAEGWSVRRHFLGEQVYNDENDIIGIMEDVIIVFDKTDNAYEDDKAEKRDKMKKLHNLEKAKIYSVVGTGGFLGIAMHNVAIPIQQFKMVDERITLPGATAEALRQLPAFEHPEQ